jgi:ankyrin repeat protein
MVSKLIKLNASDFSTPSYNGMTPFLMALLNKDQDMLNLLLDHPHKIGDINYTNELNKTYLYYTCLYNMPNIAKRILLLNGKMDILDKKNSNSPF